MYVYARARALCSTLLWLIYYILTYCILVELRPTKNVGQNVKIVEQRKYVCTMYVVYVVASR